MIPIVDLKFEEGQLGSDVHPEDVQNEISQAVEVALSKVGFVYLVNHGISKAKIEAAFTASKVFFELPTETKKKYQKDASVSFHGYSEPGQEILHESAVHEVRETFDIPTKKSDVFPDEVPEFKASLLTLKEACHPLINFLNRILAKALKLENENYFCENSNWMTDGSVESLSAFRTLYYPAIPDTSGIKPGTVRCAEHTDYGTLTLLFQDQIGGLEVKTAENVWTQATPIPGAILVNTGDLLEFWSGGYFPATTHRVLIPEIEIKRKVARQSIVYFVHPDDDTVVAPLRTDLLKPGAKYEEITAGKHALQRLKASYKY